MILLHGGPTPPAGAAFLVLLALAVTVLITAAIISDLQHKDELPAEKTRRRRARRSDG